MVATVPAVINWSVTPQNGQVGYFTLMNTWLFESTSVIDSLNTAINKINEAGEDINDIGANAISAITLDTVDDLATYAGTGLVMVKDLNRGGNFVSKTIIEINPNTGSLYVANGGTVFAKLGGGFWVRQFDGAVNVKWFGDSNLSIQLAIDYVVDSGEDLVSDMVDYEIDIPIRSATGYSSYMAYNYCFNISGLKSKIDFSMATFTLKANPLTPTRVTMFQLIGSSGIFISPNINGNLESSFLGSSYIDDSAIRIGAGCKNLEVVVNGNILNYVGHGIVIRHYTQDGQGALADTTPRAIKITGRGSVNGAWQSGVVPITGNDVIIDIRETINCGNSSSINSQIATVGHGVHCEPVSSGSNDPYLTNVTISGVNSYSNRENGITLHTAIDSFKLYDNTCYNNGGHGAEYKGYCHDLASWGNTYKHNGGSGIYISLTSAGWLGYSNKDSNATINDSCYNNSSYGILDDSSNLSLSISGYSGYNYSDGIFSSYDTIDRRIMISNMFIINNGNGNSTNCYGINALNAMVSNVRIVNTDISSFLQIPLKCASTYMTCSNLVISGESPSGFDAAVDTHPNKLPRCDTNIRLNTNMGVLCHGVLTTTTFGAGLFFLPTWLNRLVIVQAPGVYPAFRFDNSTTLYGGVTIVDTTKSIGSVTFTAVDSTIDGASSKTLLTGKVYEFYWESSTSITTRDIT